VLPATQRATDRRREDEPGFKGRLEVLSDCEVTKLLVESGRVVGVHGELHLEDGKREEIEIRAERVVLAAGAVHSSRVLMQSGLGGEHVGQRLCANIGSHMTAGWPDGEPPLRAFDGLQMSHYLPHEPGTEHMVETWFNPVMSQALIMPGWLEDHQRNMNRYDRLGCLGVIAPSDPEGHSVLGKRNAINGAEIDFTPTHGELDRLLAGLRHAGEILFDSGATRVMPATFDYREFASKEELDELRVGRWIRDASDISVNTAHPQGGNPISPDPAKGVVDERCRVHGHDNLWICDASVFPTAVRVNPQLTVMALSHYAAQQIA
jgi:choline dehydrogenase-like flavoprotein